MKVSNVNPLVRSLVKFHLNDLPIMLFDSMEDVGNNVFFQAGKSEIYCTEIGLEHLDTIFSCASSESLDGVLVKNVNRLSFRGQEDLYNLLLNADTNVRGKFIFTTSKFERIRPELFNLICKISFRFTAATESYVKNELETANGLKVSNSLGEHRL